jgi:hypothetical protein
MQFNAHTCAGRASVAVQFCGRRRILRSRFSNFNEKGLNDRSSRIVLLWVLVGSSSDSTRWTYSNNAGQQLMFMLITVCTSALGDVYLETRTSKERILSNPKVKLATAFVRHANWALLWTDKITNYNWPTNWALLWTDKITNYNWPTNSTESLECQN